MMKAAVFPIPIPMPTPDEARVERLHAFMRASERAKKQEQLDLSADQDLAVAIMNLVAIEEHFFFTGAKTGKAEYYDLLGEVRDLRKELLGRLVKEPEGEVWCVSKHLLAASYRLMEVGTKHLAAGRKEDAREFFGKAYDLYALFWGVNLKLVNPGEVTRIDANAVNRHDTAKKGFLGKLGDLVRRALDCCIE